jgi:protein phosphatase 1B
MTINEFIESNFKIIYNPHNNVESHTLEAIGGRDEMQDSTCSLASIPIPGLEGFSFYGVFDGHGAAFLSKYLANEMLNSIILADESFFNELANKSIKLNNNQIAIERMKEAMRKAFLNIDFKMRDLPELKPLMEKLANNEMEYENTVSAGSTAVICLITPEYFFIANCGDSRAILVSDDEVSLATKDHKPTDALEKDRIDKAGGIVYLHPQIKKFYIKSNRSEMSFTVSRALGDYAFKMNKRKGPNEQIISPEPDVYVRERSEKDEYLVLASDGIWEYFSNEQLKKKIQDDRHQMLNQINEAIRSGTTSIV